MTFKMLTAETDRQSAAYTTCTLGGPVFQKCPFIFYPNILINRYTPKTDIPRVSNDFETFLTLLPLAENLILGHFCHFKDFLGPCPPHKIFMKF